MAHSRFHSKSWKNDPIFKMISSAPASDIDNAIKVREDAKNVDGFSRQGMYIVCGACDPENARRDNAENPICKASDRRQLHTHQPTSIQEKVKVKASGRRQLHTRHQPTPIQEKVHVFF